METKNKENEDVTNLLVEVRNIMGDLERFSEYYKLSLRTSTVPLEIKKRVSVSTLAYAKDLIQIKEMIQAYRKNLESPDDPNDDYRRRIKEMMEDK